MRYPYEKPEAVITVFRAMEKLASEATEAEADYELDIDPASEIGGNLGVEDWNWSGN